MSSKAFVMLTASRVKTGPVRSVAGALQQETHLYDGDQCVCVLLVTFPIGSPEWIKWNQIRTLDSQPTDRGEPPATGAAASAPGPV
jgi:hypothetical protein